MTEQDKKKELNKIGMQLSSLRDNINNASAKAKDYAEKRDELNAEFKKLRQEIDELRNKRDNINQKVKALKQKRDDSRAKIKACIQEMQLHYQKIAQLKKKTLKEDYRELQKEFDDIEWKIQTTPLEIQEEKRLIERVKQLDTQLNIYKKFDLYVKKISDQRKDIEALKASVEATHQELTEIAEKSQNIHEKMMSKIAESKRIKAEAYSFHKAYIKEIEQGRPLREEIKKLTEQRRKLQAVMHEEDEKRKKNVEQALKEKLGSQAKDKLQRGEKLSWDEFKLLADEDSQD